MPVQLAEQSLQPGIVKIIVSQTYILLSHTAAYHSQGQGLVLWVSLAGAHWKGREFSIKMSQYLLPSSPYTELHPTSTSEVKIRHCSLFCSVFTLFFCRLGKFKANRWQKNHKADQKTMVVLRTRNWSSDWVITVQWYLDIVSWEPPPSPHLTLISITGGENTSNFSRHQYLRCDEICKLVDRLS